MMHKLIIPALLLLLSQAAQATDIVLIGRDLNVERLSLVKLDAERATVQDSGGSQRTIAMQDIVAIALTDVSPRLADTGLLVLADGQRLPGEPISATDEDILAWRHPWLGRLDVSLDDIASVRFRPGAHLPAPAESDAVLLTNGDRLEGFIASLGDPLLLEVDDDDNVRLLEIPRRNVASVRMVTPARQADDMRAWLADGTIINMEEVVIEEGGHVRLVTSWHAADAAPTRLMIVELAAILLDAAQLVPLASLQPHRVEGPITRYEVPPPQVLGGAAVLGLAQIEFRGPLTVRYALPRGTTRFAAEAELPQASRAWGDYELLIRDVHGERFRQRMNADDPVAVINIDFPAAADGTELTIELTGGTYGGIQDYLILNWPMLLVE